MDDRQVVEVRPRSRGDIREEAVRARRVLNLPPGPIDCEYLIEELFKFGVIVDVVEPGVLPPGVEATYEPAPSSTFYIRQDVYDDMCKGSGRGLFTLGHELGHIVLGHRRGALNRTVSYRSIPAYRNSEWQADAFSGEFTMPLDEIVSKDLFTVEKLAAHFRVSERAAAVRLSVLKQDGVNMKKPLGAPTPKGF